MRFRPSQRTRNWRAAWLGLNGVHGSRAPTGVGASPGLPAPFTPAALFSPGVAGGWWDPSDLSTLFKDAAGTQPVTADGDQVQLVKDKSGNGNNLVAIGSEILIYHVSGALTWIEGDGLADGSPQFLTGTFTITQPWTRISALQQVSWQNARNIFGGVALNAGLLQQTSGGASPQLRIFDGSGVGNNTDLAVGANGVVSEFYVNSSACSLTVNNGTAVTGTAGTTAPGGIVAGAQQTGTNPAAARFYGIVMVGAALSGQQTAQTRTFMGQKIGIGI